MIWSLEEQEDGSVVVTWGRRRRRCPSREKALAFVRENRSGADKVVEVHPDGYTTPVTRRRWRRRDLSL